MTMQRLPNQLFCYFESSAGGTCTKNQNKTELTENYSFHLCSFRLQSEMNNDDYDSVSFTDRVLCLQVNP